MFRLACSYEGNALEDPWAEPDESMFTRSVSPESVSRDTGRVERWTPCWHNSITHEHVAEDASSNLITAQYSAGSAGNSHLACRLLLPAPVTYTCFAACQACEDVAAHVVQSAAGSSGGSALSLLCTG
jgi:hypothetical protein